jgi:hypothetical protein
MNVLLKTPILTRWLVAAALLVCVGVFAQVPPGPTRPPSTQMVLVDGVFSWSQDGYLNDMAPRQTPTNWLAPIDFKNGRIHVKVTVLEKRNITNALSVVCRLSTGTHEDRKQFLRIGQGLILTKPGAYYIDESVADLPPLVPPNSFSWEKPARIAQVVVTDPGGQMVSKFEKDLGEFTGQMRDYFPLRVQFTAILVAAGETFKPPPGWKLEPKPAVKPLQPVPPRVAPSTAPPPRR